MDTLSVLGESTTSNISITPEGNESNSNSSGEVPL